MTHSEPQIPDALLLIATGCSHCPTVLEGLNTLIKQGLISELRVVNVTREPDRAAELGVRSVPWTRLGPFELEGTLSPAQLRHWAEAAGTREGVAEYIKEQLAQGRLDRVEHLMDEHPDWAQSLVALMEDTEAPMQVRVGIGALFEHLGANGVLGPVVEALGALTRHPDHRVRGDACHYLALSGDDRARAYLSDRIGDENAEVREIAAESLETLNRGQ